MFIYFRSYTKHWVFLRYVNTVFPNNCDKCLPCTVPVSYWIFRSFHDWIFNSGLISSLFSAIIRSIAIINLSCLQFSIEVRACFCWYRQVSSWSMKTNLWIMARFSQSREFDTMIPYKNITSNQRKPAFTPLKSSF